MNNLIKVSIVLVIIFIINRPDKMPMATLSVHDENALTESTDIVGGSSCLAEKCLIVYVAPWCPSCKRVMPTLISLVDELKKDGMTAKVVVGYDSPEKIAAYAKNFPFPVLTDANASYYKEAGLVGVPSFFVINSTGEILTDYFGGYSTVTQFREKLEI
jgi:thiol-disulfide isomerase/thioredoxin